MLSRAYITMTTKIEQKQRDTRWNVKMYVNKMPVVLFGQRSIEILMTVTPNQVEQTIHGLTQLRFCNERSKAHSLGR